ncbi:uncharacterized protein [Physcomitrium patens]|uniref:Uncharacterized protein n=1 Tax=Physcomitrium patens TaxID=3218 RepID=A0A2K1KE77_PHYPA|nr:uncharacterized protein LOC112283638 [Physcomitrium patens]XP_024378420.1 uncharacterized protein LOC112283638 [Physcomitrium patens]XP_024378421.1 uncharacterized protein LOC112283638 [Physcomitrium patens]PNR52080.1 hypothetical protein PHYPA_008454 [Physcomitrium patens]|eukprot:XP_024378419.1 uncharacterized protein LOC112283638 [Physcomitrella patens]
MPEPSVNEDTKVREKSLKRMASPTCGSSPSYARCSDCPGRNRTPMLHADHCSSDNVMLNESGVESEVKAEVVLNKAPQNQAIESSPSCSFRQQFEVGTISQFKDSKVKDCEEAPSPSDTASCVADPSVFDSTPDIRNALTLSPRKRPRNYFTSEVSVGTKELKRIGELPEQPESSKARVINHLLCAQSYATTSPDISYSPSFSIDLDSDSPGGIRSDFVEFYDIG